MPAPWLKLAFSFLFFLVLFAALDLVVGHLDCRRKLRELEASRNQPEELDLASAGMRSEQFHHGLRPDFDGTNQWGPHAVVFRTDSLGFRSEINLHRSLTPAAWRVVFMGDSFLEGVGLSYEQTLVGSLDQMLDSSTHPPELINAGVSSFSPKLHYLRTVYLWEEHGFRFNESWIFIDTSDVPDELAYTQFRPAGNGGRHDLNPHADFEMVFREPGFFERSFAYRTVMRALFRQDPWNRLTFRNSEDGTQFDYYGERDQWVLQDRLFLSWGKTGLELAEYYTALLVEFLQKRGVKVGIAAYPWPREIRAGTVESRNAGAWVRFTKARQLPFLNLYGPFMTGTPEEVIRAYFIDGDVHWNAEGHRLVAAQWLEYRRSLGDFPELSEAPGEPLDAGWTDE